MAKYAICLKGRTKPYEARFNSPEEAWEFVHPNNRKDWDVVKVIPATGETYRKLTPTTVTTWSE